MDTCQHSLLHLIKACEEKRQADSTTHLHVVLPSVGTVRLMDNFSSLAICKMDFIAFQVPAPVN